MLENFLRYYSLNEEFRPLQNFYKSFMKQFRGRSLGNGLFRVFEPKNVIYWEDNVSAAFPWAEPFIRRCSLVGYDWQGVIYAFGSDPRGEVSALFDVGRDEFTCERIPHADLLDVVLTHPADTMEGTLFSEWMAAHGNEPLPYTDCVSYDIPLDYGGKSELSNMRLCDMDVYWNVFTQFREQKQGKEARRKVPPKWR